MVDEDDHDTSWEEYTKQVKPLEGKEQNPKTLQPIQRPSLKAVRAKPRPMAAAAPQQKKGEVHDINHGETAGIDKRTAQRFKQGKMEIDAKLDLHGMTQDQAHSALADFISHCHSMGHRCVIVVTGKGSRSAETGILKQRVPQWLNQPPCRGCILSFSYARPNHGGDGALYVLLKRKR